MFTRIMIITSNMIMMMMMVMVMMVMMMMTTTTTMTMTMTIIIIITIMNIYSGAVTSTPLSGAVPIHTFRMNFG